MSFWELFAVAVSLSMDAFAVSICKGLSVRRPTVRQGLTCALYFGGFQGLMPALGWLLGSAFAQMISSVDHWIAFILLVWIGAGMIKDSRSCAANSADFSAKTMLAMAVATSIDALAAGVTFSFLSVNIVSAVLLIALTTGILSFVGVMAGSYLGEKFQSGAQMAGGIVLILMGVKILLDHLGIL